MKLQGIKITDEEMEKISSMADKSGLVILKSHKSDILPIIFQMRKADFEKYSRDSQIFKDLDKNKDGHVSVTEVTSKAEMAFKVCCFSPTHFHGN